MTLFYTLGGAMGEEYQEMTVSEEKEWKRNLYVEYWLPLGVGAIIGIGGAILIWSFVL